MNDSIEMVFKSLKDDMKNNFINLTNQIEKLRESIEHYQDKTNASSSDIKVINEKIATLDKRLTDNFEQHAQFYTNFNNLNKIIYKISGGIILASALVGTILKLLKVI